jgi:hypothetical protein
MKQSTTTSVGDIFQIPIDENRVGFGQIVARKLGPNPDLVIVFDFADSPSVEYSPDELKQIVEKPILLVANTFDVLIKNGSWKKIGNLESQLARVPLPCYKSGSGHFGRVAVESYDGKKRRIASREEIASLDNRNSVGPIRLEKALKAKYGLIPWTSSFDKISLAHVQKASEVSFGPLKSIVSIFG